jgi:site-specific DNA-methyltransferase (adenine-specific)
MSELGPYQRNEIYTGECADMMSRLPDGCIDLTVTSPPYDNLRSYNGYTFDYTAVLQQLYRVTKPGGVVVWVVADATINGSETGTSFRQALYAMECGFNLHDTMIYWRDNPPMNDNRYQHEFEYMFILSKGTPVTFNGIKTKKTYKDGRKTKAYHRYKNGDYRINELTDRDDKLMGNIWRIGGGGGKSTHDNYAHDHPAIFPEALARDHILSWSNPGDIVLDPMMGSGTVAKMAMQNGRDYLGFDISQEYVELAQKRVAWANPPLLVFG